MLTAASKYTLYRRQSLLLPATDLARMNAVLTGNLVHRFMLLQSLQGYSPLGLRAVTFAFYCHRFSPCDVDIFILVSGPKYGEYHSSAGEVTLPLNVLVGKEVNLKGSMRFHDEFSQAVRYINDKTINVAPLITHTFPLADAEQAIHAAADRNSAMKVQLGLG